MFFDALAKKNPMNKYSINLIVVLLVICIFTFSKKFSPEEANTTINPANENATSATKELLQLLHRIQNQHTIIGHQDDLAYGNGWRYNVYNPKGYISDIYNAGGDFPEFLDGILDSWKIH